MTRTKSIYLALVVVLLSPMAANADIIVADWHLTTDGFGGLKQSQLSEDVFFAVSISNVFDDTETYEMLSGYHWATSDEYISLIGETSSASYAYYNQGGWFGYNWEAVDRYQFIFSDTQSTDRIQHAGNLEYARWVREILYHQGYGNNYFAGFVLVKDASSVPEPGTLALFGIGLLGMGLARRRRKV